MKISSFTQVLILALSISGKINAEEIVAKNQIDENLSKHIITLLTNEKDIERMTYIISKNENNEDLTDEDIVYYNNLVSEISILMKTSVGTYF